MGATADNGNGSNGHSTMHLIQSHTSESAFHHPACFWGALSLTHSLSLSFSHCRSHSRSTYYCVRTPFVPLPASYCPSWQTKHLTIAAPLLQPTAVSPRCQCNRSKSIVPSPQPGLPPRPVVSSIHILSAQTRPWGARPTPSSQFAQLPSSKPAPPSPNNTTHTTTPAAPIFISAMHRPR